MSGARTPVADRELLMRYLDGEATAEERASIETRLHASSELQRELAIFRSIKSDLGDLSFTLRGRGSLWGRIRSRITLPIGWTLATGGFLAWLGYGVWAFLASPSAVPVKLATGAVAIGILVLLAHVIWDRCQEYGTDPYRGIHR